MKTGQAVDIYKALESATVKELTADERISVVKVMKAFRGTSSAHDAFVKDLQERFKTPNFESIAQKIHMGKGLTEAEFAEFNEYNTPVGKAVSEERDKEIDIEIPKMSEEAVLKLIGENGWKMSKFETFGIICS